MKLLVTGGFGFIGSNFVLRHLQKFPNDIVIVLDKFTYAANPANLNEADKNRLVVYRGDIGNEELVANILSAHEPDAIVNFAAESHVDRSITGSAPFIKTNIVGLATLLDLARQYAAYRSANKLGFRFLQVSTDEVYGSLLLGSALEGMTPYAPRSPYAASKAAGDHLCNAYYITHKLPVIITNSGNNYGPRQHPEKFIPTAILSLMAGRKIPVYGDGQNVREWIYVDDNCDALEAALEFGQIGGQYNISAPYAPTNLELATTICTLMGIEPTDAIEFVADRPGHDFRYSLDMDRTTHNLKWVPQVNLLDGLTRTIKWYRENHLV